LKQHYIIIAVIRMLTLLVQPDVLGVNVAGPNCYVILHDGCIYIYKNERSKTAAKACSLYGFLQYDICTHIYRRLK